MNKSPIGIFDSGIGGLTIANAISKELPNENIIYFGDTKHLPYGEKSNKSIQLFSKDIVDFLLFKKCKAIVIACNSASAIASNTVKNKVKNIPVFNVIDPVVKEISEKFSNYNIGVIGTKATIQSKVYEKKINKKCPNAKVSSLATPLLAPMIEERFINEEISHTVIANYLSNKKLKNIDTLILACTHYPLIYNEIKSYYKNEVTVINSTKIISKHISSSLKELNMLNNNPKTKYQFYISNYTKEFERSAKLFFKQDLILKEKDLNL